MVDAEVARTQQEKTLQSSIKDLETALSAKTRDFEIAQARISDAQLRLGQLTVELDQSRATQNHLEVSLKTLEARSKMEQDSLKRLESEYQALSAERKTLEVEKVKLTADRDQYKERALKAEATSQSLDTIRRTLTEQGEEREREIAALSGRLAQMERQLAAAETSLDGVRGDLKEIRKKDK